mmetsp:Transcript_5114/g.10800  ORF Transcript_5114/g.10800 Transcript_5114/m.10800 type:complete len:248 (-) Transcript_5114:85-828(-)|eukprot:CAMPEP_0194329642 /NCGR_PEP_ID=MMETSP0171-20130528/48918_1 /TAXON_ID=218684 /ORGANISM="Corethron pennatum, Strain L29A3" /LENGTH=247 /DNA_ID=CAMNT_0039090433 /DNA_START=46 /DNA_END=789 /DNA_ORIENTATION=-
MRNLTIIKLVVLTLGFCPVSSALLSNGSRRPIRSTTLRHFSAAADASDDPYAPIISRPVPPGTAPLGAVTIVVPNDPSTPCIPGTYGESTIRDVAVDFAARINDAEQRVAASVVASKSFVKPAPGVVLPTVVMVLQLVKPGEIAKVKNCFNADITESTTEPLCFFALDCAKPLQYDKKPEEPLAGRVGSYLPFVPPLVALLPWTNASSDRRLHNLMVEKLESRKSDEFVSSVLSFVNGAACRPSDDS